MIVYRFKHHDSESWSPWEPLTQGNVFKDVEKVFAGPSKYYSKTDSTFGSVQKLRLTWANAVYDFKEVEDGWIGYDA